MKHPFGNPNGRLFLSAKMLVNMGNDPYSVWSSYSILLSYGITSAMEKPEKDSQTHIGIGYRMLKVE